MGSMVASPAVYNRLTRRRHTADRRLAPRSGPGTTAQQQYLTGPRSSTGIAMRTKQEDWQRLTSRARWYELPQQSLGWGAVGGLTTACLGLLVMFVQFYLQYNMLIFWWGLTAFLIGSAAFAYAERSVIVRIQWRSQREYLLESRGKSHRCMHLEGELPTHLRDARQAHCKYYDRTFSYAPLCVYCDAYSPEIAPAEGVAPVQESTAGMASAAS